jgi:hypothetical protein
MAGPAAPVEPPVVAAPAEMLHAMAGRDDPRTLRARAESWPVELSHCEAVQHDGEWTRFVEFERQERWPWPGAPSPYSRAGLGESLSWYSAAACTRFDAEVCCSRDDWAALPWLRVEFAPVWFAKGWSAVPPRSCGRAGLSAGGWQDSQPDRAWPDRPGWLPSARDWNVRYSEPRFDSWLRCIPQD